MDTAAAGTRHTCVKLEIYTPASEPVFVKGTWFEGRFDLSITDGLHSWVCHAREEDARDRAARRSGSASIRVYPIGVEAPGLSNPWLGQEVRRCRRWLQTS
ncbi:unnamed protein product [Linum tenue]|uniref:XRCC4 N-terminal domain-containing protein n=1 Tax=Linum tenue TaxID=586396 RepID=A0AAV0KHP8_9ROSI|nr:unnamed protein product [Linum tenue]